MHDASRPGPLRAGLSTIPALLVLLLAVAQGTSELVQARMLAFGEETWPGYAEMRKDPQPPDCDADAIGADQGKAATAEDELLDDLFDEEPSRPAEPEKPAGGDDALLDDLFGDEGGDASANAAAIQAAKDKCRQAHADYEALIARITPTLRGYRSVDHVLSRVTNAGRSSARPSLVLLIAICAATASALGAHIMLRPVRTTRDNQVSSGIQLLVNGVAAITSLAHYQLLAASSTNDGTAWLFLVWAGGFGAMALFALRDLAQPPDGLAPGGGLIGALLTVPLYAWLGLIASTWFLLFEAAPPGQVFYTGLAIFLDKLTEHSGLYLQVGMFVWAGMLLKQTRLADATFDVLRPWAMSPEMMAAVVVLASAIPTAYSGASGIFVIAAGATIYDELRKAGARNQLALASTAMSGSMGVVLNPCLLVVIVASLNRQVTTTMLFGAGTKVFGLSALLFLGVLFLTRRAPLHIAPASEALGPSRQALAGLLPYAALLLMVLGVFGFGLNAWLDEHSAARILLVILLSFIIWEGAKSAREGGVGVMPRLSDATTETTLHIGALLVLMAFSVGFGGVVERAQVMEMVPQDLGGPIPTMVLLTLVLVLIGMVMDPYGAVILVSATLAHVADRNGVDALHFWMVVLVAFELGYLTPPVALNHLLTRAVVGDPADDPDVPADAGFYYQHERLLLPVAVMGSSLLLVAFVPLWWT